MATTHPARYGQAMVRQTLRTTVVTCSAFAALTIVTACSAADGAETATTATASTVSDDANSTSTAGTSTTSQVIVASTAVDSSPTLAIPDSLNWSANLIGGGSIDLATYAGQDVLLWFWAPY